MSVPRSFAVAALVLVAVLFLPTRALALEELCDPAHQNCEAPLLNLIRNETKGIDVAFWFMKDTTIASEIIKRWQAGVPVRVLVDSRANADYSQNATVLAMLKNAGIPMRNKTGGGILHWKTMLFVGQSTVEFSGANYSSNAFAYGTAYTNYEDEVIYFTDRTSIVDSFKTRYDDAWTNTSLFVNYANVRCVCRNYPTYTIDPQMNFVPWNDYRTRAVNAYNAETQTIDAIMYRITDRAHSDALIKARARGVNVRLITEQNEYRNPSRLWDAWNVDRMYIAGIQVRERAHAGLSHEKLVVLLGQKETFFGSSNWTSPSATSQYEHNIFTTDTTIFNWVHDHFNRKWYNLGPSPETQPFTPLPPDTPSLKSPGNGATGIGGSVTLKWYAGPWAHKYDVYVGTDSSNMTKVLSDYELGPSQSSTDYKSFTVSNLAAGRTYYWKIVSRTMANRSATSTTWSFATGTSGSTASGTTSGSTSTATLPSGWNQRDIGSVSAAGSGYISNSTLTANGSGADIWGSADEFHFVYHALTGNGSITARVTSVKGPSSWTKAGVMMRETLTAGSKHASMFASTGHGLAFQRRTATGGTSANTAGVNTTAPYWVRVTRSGSTFYAYESADGSSWKLAGSATMNMASTIYVGVAVTAHSDGSIGTGTFTNVR
jgi:phosphatidylserine/phosphatidylglycerophosphate/cardiolipin synthase-like enzyme/regulation of enolase protein 1 (concanavalin A-like superfamily)